MMLLIPIVIIVAGYTAFLVALNLCACYGRRGPSPISPTRVRSSAFSLVELLVVIGVSAMLIGLLLPTLTGARQTARHIKALSDVRQLLWGYTFYHQSNRGWLLLGYTPPTVQGQPVTISDSNTGYMFGMPVADRYPWRLAPYCDNIWGVLYSHGDVPPLPRKGDTPEEAMGKAYMLSLTPSFGLNSIYLGGHWGFGGFAGPGGDHPNAGKHVAFKASEVRRPAEQIVFVETQTRNAPFIDPGTGLHFVTPPRANGLRWTVQNEQFVVHSAMITGVPQGRFGSRAAVGFFDGHAESRRPSQLTDMRLWAPRADRADYDFVP